MRPPASQGARALLALTVVLAGLVSVPAAHEAVPASTKIVYESYSDGDFEIYAADPETHAVLKLTNNTYEDSAPTPSPDGTKVAFYSASGTAVVNADGTGRRKLAGCYGYSLSWSPDSSRIACEGDDGMLAVIHSDGTGVRSLGVEGSSPSWSPDGTTIAYVSPDDAFIHAVDPDGGNARVLAGVHSSNLNLSTWSPDSTMLAFVSEEQGSLRNDLYVVRATGHGLLRLVTNIFDERPAWSPDGRLIAYTGRPTKNTLAVYTISPNGTGKGLAAAGRHGESVSGPSWSPVGLTLAYIRARFANDGTDGDVFAVTDEEVRVRLTEAFPTGGSVSAVRWARGSLEGGTPAHKLPWLSLPKNHQVGGKPVLAAVFGSGRTAAAPQQAQCAPFVVWKLGKRSRSVDPCGNVDVLLDLGVAGDQLAWVTAAFSHTEYPQYLEVADPGRRSLVISTAQADPDTGAGEYIDSLHGDGSLLAFNFWHENGRGGVSDLTTWRVVPGTTSSAAKCPASTGELAPGFARKRCLHLRAGDGMRLLSVAGGRIVGVKSGRLVRILDPSGLLIRSQQVSTEVLGAQVHGSRLLVLTAAQLLVYNSKGAQVAHYPLAKGPGLPSPLLLHGYGNFALYWRGAVHLVRLSDGRDRLLRSAGQAPPVDAQLGKGGLFYAYNQLYTRRPGRILFVPRARLNALVRAG